VSDVPAARVAGWVTGELAGALRAAGSEASRPGPERVASAIEMVESGRINHAGGRAVLRRLVLEDIDPATVVAEEGLEQTEDSDELEAVVERAIEAEPEAAARVRDGNAKAIGPLVGAVMRETRGRADGAEVTRLIRERLGAG
jgi:aspartyl-tRNA(Asn)/glutamyl-tRNA(Gln) amidotransferase subunit B